MANAKQATINGGRSVERIVGRLGRIQQAIAHFEALIESSGILDVSHRRRCEDKIRRLRAEAAVLTSDLMAIKQAIGNLA
jgi:hypothetical protein